MGDWSLASCLELARIRLCWDEDGFQAFCGLFPATTGPVSISDVRRGNCERCRGLASRHRRTIINGEFVGPSKLL